MKEQDYIKIIEKQTMSTFLGDDCAYLKDLGIVVTQDNFIENVHFKKEWATPYQIGYKAAAVNISDILASGAKPAYITVGLSIPKVSNSFIEELYQGIKAGSYGAEVIGGDITKADNIFISITAIGTTSGRKIASRSNAKPGYVVITNDNHGLSKKGFEELQKGIKTSEAISAHLEPKLDVKFSEAISTQINKEYAMMDTSDGLADALFKIAQSSNCSIITDNINGAFGYEDYKLLAAVPEELLNTLKNYIILGKVEEYNGTRLKIGDKSYNNYEELELYNHFGENNE